MIDWGTLEIGSDLEESSPRWRIVGERGIDWIAGLDCWIAMGRVEEIAKEVDDGKQSGQQQNQAGSVDRT